MAELLGTSGNKAVALLFPEYRGLVLLLQNSAAWLLGQQTSLGGVFSSFLNPWVWIEILGWPKMQYAAKRQRSGRYIACCACIFSHDKLHVFDGIRRPDVPAIAVASGVSTALPFGELFFKWTQMKAFEREGLVALPGIEPGF
jgi:hypothetical protein